MTIAFRISILTLSALMLVTLLASFSRAASPTQDAAPRVVEAG